MKSEESTSKNKQKKDYKKGTRFFMFLFVLVILVALIPALVVEYNKKDEGKEGYTLYNASRYFFRFYYPDSWILEKEASGFLMDDETGLVVTASPCSSVKISFYYKLGGFTMENTIKDFENQFSDYTFGELDKINVENQNITMYSKPLSFTSEETGETINGAIYFSTRSIAHYAIVVTYSGEDEYNFYKGEISEVLKSYFHSVTVLDETKQ